jgi:hypothetical protein
MTAVKLRALDAVDAIVAMAQPLICGAHQSSHLRCHNVIFMIALGVRFNIRYQEIDTSPNPTEKFNGCDDCKDCLSVTGASCKIMYLLITPHSGAMLLQSEADHFCKLAYLTDVMFQVSYCVGLSNSML